jgi:hypothetical protein
MTNPARFLRAPLLALLLVASAEPSPNFLACTVWVSGAPQAEVPADRCCADEETPALPVSASVKAHPALPCCDTVIPNTSVSEHHRIVLHDPVRVATIVPALDLPLFQPLAFPWRVVPPPADVGKEILVLNLRI